MRLLLDSQVLLWSIYNTNRLPFGIATLLSAQEHTCFVSDASLWEIGVKISRARLEYVAEPHVFYRHVSSLEVTRLPISIRHIEHAVLLPHIHGDPFDRILIAQAQTEGLTLVSVDADIQRYDVDLIR